MRINLLNRNLSQPKIVCDLSPQKTVPSLQAPIYEDFTKKMKLLEANLIKRKRSENSKKKLDGVTYSIIGGLSVPRNYPIQRLENLHQSQIVYSKGTDSTRGFNESVTTMKSRPAALDLSPVIPHRMRGASEFSTIHKQYSIFSDSDSPNKSTKSSVNSELSRFVYRDMFMKQKEKDEQVNENRKKQRHSIKLKIEKDILQQREQDNQKAERLKLNRENYDKYLKHLDRGFDILTNSNLAESPPKLKPLIERKLKPWEHIEQASKNECPKIDLFTPKAVPTRLIQNITQDSAQTKSPVKAMRHSGVYCLNVDNDKLNGKLVPIILKVSKGQ